MDLKPPAMMSEAAARLLAEGDATTQSSNEEMTIEELRAATLEAYRPGVEISVEKLGITTRDISVNGVRCMEVIPPQTNSGRQVLYLFGGGFVQGSPFEDLPISGFIAATTGATVICPYYRLAPEHPFPAALDDVTAVAQELLSKKPDTLLAGESAGGNLSLALVHRLRSNNQIVPKAMAVLSPAVDLSSSGDSVEADRDPFLRADRIPFVRSSYIGDQNPTNPEISPIYGEFSDRFPDTLVTSGTRDLLLSGCVRLARVMREAGASIDLRVWEGMWHVFEFYPEIPEAEASLREICEFLEGYF